MNKTKGFSLLELMIVVAIIGILTLTVMPFYGDYTRKTLVSEALTLILPIKSEIIDYYNEEGKLPYYTEHLTSYKNGGTGNNNHGTMMFPLNSSHEMGADGFVIAEHGIYIYFPDSFQQRLGASLPIEIVVFPQVKDGSIRFYCGREAEREIGFGNGKVTTQGANRMNDRYLPSVCR